jgi:hypothetical protein
MAARTRRGTLDSNHYKSLKIDHFRFIGAISRRLAGASVGLQSISALSVICPSFGVLYARALAGNRRGQVGEITLVSALWHFHDFACLFLLLL